MTADHHQLCLPGQIGQPLCRADVLKDFGHVSVPVVAGERFDQLVHPLALPGLQHVEQLPVHHPLAAEIAHPDRRGDLPHVHNAQRCVRHGGHVERFCQRTGRMVRLIHADDDGKWLAGPPGDRLPPDHQRAVRPVGDLHGVSAQRAMLRRAGAHHQ